MIAGSLSSNTGQADALPQAFREAAAEIVDAVGEVHRVERLLDPWPSARPLEPLGA
jgi:hypothetical protein